MNRAQALELVQKTSELNLSVVGFILKESDFRDFAEDLTRELFWDIPINPTTTFKDSFQLFGYTWKKEEKIKGT